MLSSIHQQRTTPNPTATATVFATANAKTNEETPSIHSDNSFIYNNTTTTTTKTPSFHNKKTSNAWPGQTKPGLPPNPTVALHLAKTRQANQPTNQPTNQITPTKQPTNQITPTKPSSYDANELPNKPSKHPNQPGQAKQATHAT